MSATSSRHDRRATGKARVDSRSIGLHQTRHSREELSGALRALLMTPLMTSAHEEFGSVRRHADTLREWFAREAGWTLHIERDCARLYKRPADLTDTTRGLPGYDRRRYALLCLACAVLERSDPQITLRVLGERLLVLAADPALATQGFTFTLQAQHERRELVAVCRTLLELGVLQRVAGDEEGFVRETSADSNAVHDALYDIQRRVLAGMLAAVRGPSTWKPNDAPVEVDERIRALVTEHVQDSDEGRRAAIRHSLSRRLLDDPVIYLDSLPASERAYFINQRGTMAARLTEASGLVAEQRAEGLALTDESDTLTDVSMPAEGTDAHITLLVAEFLAGRHQQGLTDAAESEVAYFVGTARDKFGRYWRKSAREPGSEQELARTAILQLQKLQLIVKQGDSIRPLPALARFSVGRPEIRSSSGDQLPLLPQAEA